MMSLSLVLVVRQKMRPPSILVIVSVKHTPILVCMMPLLLS